MLSKLFIEHPREVGETYAEHFGVATSFGMEMVKGGLACLVHALVPGLCKTTGSDTVRRLHVRMVEKRNAKRKCPIESRAVERVI